jgi:hypothetical protein
MSSLSSSDAMRHEWTLYPDSIPFATLVPSPEDDIILSRKCSHGRVAGAELELPPWKRTGEYLPWSVPCDGPQVGSECEYFDLFGSCPLLPEDKSVTII